MIDNQVQQITTLGNQLSEFKNYESLFGNPSQVVLSMVAPLNPTCRAFEPGKNLENLVSSADGNYALTYNDSGIYATVGVSFQTPGGPDRPTARRPIQTVCGNQWHGEQNYVTVARQRGATRATIKDQIAQTTSNSRTPHGCRGAELHGVLTSLTAIWPAPMTK